MEVDGALEACMEVLNINKIGKASQPVVRTKQGKKKYWSTDVVVCSENPIKPPNWESRKG